MGQPFVGEIRMFGGNFAPAGWQFCDGSLLAISENDVLFALIGTTYGGDGQNTFAVPDLRGRVPVHQFQGPGLSNRIIGELAGTESVTVTSQQLPIHSHPVQISSNTGTTGTPSAGVTLGVADVDLYIAESPAVNMNAGSISSVGGSQPHSNIQPYLAVNFIISLFGIFPSPA
jgi:microcystin-dependent protein